MTTLSPWNGAANILCIRLDSLGDVLMTTPALRALKESRAGRRITLLTSRSGAAAAALAPEIDDLVVYDAPWMKSTPLRHDASHECRVIDILRNGHFDAAVIFCTFSQNPLPAATLAWLAGIPLRLAHCRENPYQLLTDWVREPDLGDPVRHEVRRQLDLVAHVGCETADERIMLQPLESDRLNALRLLKGFGLDASTEWLVIHPGATAPSRRYPPELFARAIRRLVHDFGFRVVLTGTAAEVDLVESIRMMAAAPTESLAGELRIGELAALLESAPLLLSNNSGPVHVAAGVSTPVVDLYAMTNPQHTPWQVRHRVLSRDVPCRNCYRSICPEGHHDCLRRIEPDEVVQAVLDLHAECAHSTDLDGRVTTAGGDGDSLSGAREPV
jgi:lipopolysaccharide heptosyltransferase II